MKQKESYHVPFFVQGDAKYSVVHSEMKYGFKADFYHLLRLLQTFTVVEFLLLGKRAMRGCLSHFPIV